MFTLLLCGLCLCCWLLCRCRLLAGIDAHQASLVGCCTQFRAVRCVLHVHDSWMSLRQRLLGLGRLLDLSLELLLLLGEQSTSTGDFAVWVELRHLLRVLQWIETTLGTVHGLLGRCEHTLDLVRLQDASEVGVGHDWMGQIVVLLHGRCGVPCAEQVVQVLEGRLGPDAEASHVTAGRELEQVHLVNAHCVDTGNVAEGATQAIVLGEDDERSLLVDATTIAHLTATGTQVL